MDWVPKTGRNESHMSKVSSPTASPDVSGVAQKSKFVKPTPDYKEMPGECFLENVWIKVRAVYCWIGVKILSVR